MRILTEHEMHLINNEMPSDAKYGDVFKAIAQFQAEVIRLDVLDILGKHTFSESKIKDIEAYFKDSK